MEIETCLNRAFPYSVEIRCLGDRHRGQKVISETVNSFTGILDRMNALEEGYNCYFTINPVNPDSRTNSNKDTDILSREYIVIDVDPLRFTPEGEIIRKSVPSTDSEKDSAIAIAKAITRYLKSYGFYDPIIADSGNGVHLFYRISMENTVESRELIKAFLEKLDTLFSDDKSAHVDTTMYNASRIIRLYGTWNKKNTETKNRPFRKSFILKLPENVYENVNATELVELIAQKKRSDTGALVTDGNGLSENKVLYKKSAKLVKKLLDKWGLTVQQARNLDNGSKKIFLADGCPFNPEHQGKDSYIQIFNTGFVFFKCSHNSCVGKNWIDFIRVFEPGETWQHLLYTEYGIDFGSVEEGSDTPLNERPVTDTPTESTTTAASGNPPDGTDTDLWNDLTPSEVNTFLRKRVLKNGNVEAVSCSTNYEFILKRDKKFKGLFGYNEFTDMRSYGPGKDMRDEYYLELRTYINATYPPLDNKADIIDAYQKLCYEKRFNPFQKFFLDTLPEWDGTNRIENVLHEVGGSPDDEYTREVSRIIFMGIIWRTLVPGCYFATMPILYGDQGTGKSTFCRRLAIDSKWYAEGVKPNLGSDRQFAEQFRGAVVAEWSELRGMRKAEIEEVKSRISATAEFYRRPFAREPEENPRRCIFIATTNERMVLRDTTGNRRFLPVPFPGGGTRSAELIEPHFASSDYWKQCYAEAYARFKKGEPCTIKNSVRAEALEKANECMEEHVYQHEFDVWLNAKVKELKRNFDLKKENGEAISVWDSRVTMEDFKDFLITGKYAIRVYGQIALFASLFDKVPFLAKVSNGERIMKSGTLLKYHAWFIKNWPDLGTSTGSDLDLCDF